MLSDRLIKVDFSRGFPSLSKYDKEISLEIAEIKGADVNKIRLTKRLYDKQFTLFEKIAQDFQNYFYSITERWGKDFILPSFLFESFNEKYQKAKEDFEKITGEDFEPFWYSKAINTLRQSGLLVL